MPKLLKYLYAVAVVSALVTSVRFWFDNGNTNQAIHNKLRIAPLDRTPVTLTTEFYEYGLLEANSGTESQLSPSRTILKTTEAFIAETTGFPKHEGVDITTTRPVLGASEVAQGMPVPPSLLNISDQLIWGTFSDEDARVTPVPFNINASDKLVVMHIQKTGGSTFEYHLVKDTDIKPRCKCRHSIMTSANVLCGCVNDKRRLWMFQRLTVRWPCGCHADYSTLTYCLEPWFKLFDRKKRVEVRKFHYVTVLRDPTRRFLSEWRHVQRGAEWKEFLVCDGHRNRPRICYRGENWANVTLSEFMSCETNLAINRQTRMLANMTLSDCYETESNLSRRHRDEIMLASAKYNLARFFRFFGLLERELDSARLFGATFDGINFHLETFQQEPTVADSTLSTLTDFEKEEILRLNYLDVRLLEFARALFAERLKNAQLHV
ncbi:heparan-sulfate 6-O-sulfotransferase 2 [Aplysia californica]|uniref:Heparan-sulfate 6-O-sulfotransferase n=1 Tax=Aplysia californica TaxID=6500 RepID=A0ABM0JY29_APLCA|nr:heparan-sulfate 6-O-sulfotransferase 2 [Aplysia californica]